METILDRIIEQKKKELTGYRENLRNMVTTAKPKRSFLEKLRKADEISIIAEYKRASPSKGIINEDVEPQDQARQYESFGASAISVLTDQTFFKGSFADLRAVRVAVDLPILCKDFIIDPVQIDLASAYGADIILLIVAALPEQNLKELYQYAAGRGLEILVEVHNRAELDKALNLGAELIGINNRDLKTFNVNLEVTEQLAAAVKNSGAFLISESGIHHQNDVDRVRKAGANGILVGESLMKSPDVRQSFTDFRLPLAGGMKS